ncbi:hypothetical protein SAMN07250955_107179 [Arboricoccus pini]|uniref:Uncharacterized protein n=1 Tax=Arboricoccus pini TaxID=1963835 RepID=A0A212RDJ6_9PROT|nr:hypothetical protein [Arboricoccus pini]SNB70364.1 hypothetical protein SAMN07250955_107179 [Arboricoccus pini]
MMARNRRGFENGLELFKALHAAFPRMNLLVASSDRAARRAARCSGLPVHVYPLPLPFLGADARFITALQPNLLLLPDGGRGLPRRLIDRLAVDGAATLMLGRPRRGLMRRLSLAPDLIVVPPAERAALAVADDPATTVIELDHEHASGTMLAPVVDRATPLIVAKRELYRRSVLKRDRALEPPPQGFRAVETLEELRQRLGGPQNIICLGNGPSSEDPRLADFAFDCCFRVNHSWATRGFLTTPDMVFTGAKQSIERLPEQRLFGFFSIESERDILGRFTATSRKLDYATAERLGSTDFSRFGFYRPTNGAVMIAVAVALRPARLIVGGIDLFRHPAGTYPGDTSTPNAYAAPHAPDLELDFILDMLESLEGEIVIVGDVLREEWDKRQQARARQSPSGRPAPLAQGAAL